MSTRRVYKLYSVKQKYDKRGRPRCIQCLRPIRSPRRRTFCSDACSFSFRIRSSTSFARKQVWKRDHGVCALCRRETVVTKPRYYRGTGELWQADHIVPVCEGGGECGLENLRTLCTRCHMKVTRQLMKRRSRIPNIQKGNK